MGDATIMNTLMGIDLENGRNCVKCFGVRNVPSCADKSVNFHVLLEIPQVQARMNILDSAASRSLDEYFVPRCKFFLCRAIALNGN